MEQTSRIGMDTSKHFFQLHGVNAAEEPVVRKKLHRAQMVAYFEKLEPTVIAIEACGGSHHWARLLASFGHEVKLIKPPENQPCEEGVVHIWVGTGPMPRARNRTLRLDAG